MGGRVERKGINEERVSNVPNVPSPLNSMSRSCY